MAPYDAAEGVLAPVHSLVRGLSSAAPLSHLAILFY